MLSVDVTTVSLMLVSLIFCTDFLKTVFNIFQHMEGNSGEANGFLNAGDGES